MTSEYPECPWCGRLVMEPYDLNWGDDDDVKVYGCEGCDKEFEIRRRVSVLYSTDKIVEWRECERCGGTGTRNLDERELKACGLEMGSVTCENCVDGKEYVTARWQHAESVMKHFED